MNIRNLTKLILENKGYRVLLAADGVEALQKVEIELPEYILLNVVMPASELSVGNEGRTGEQLGRLPHNNLHQPCSR